MVVGIGCDIVENERILSASGKKSFLDRIFTENERKLIEEFPGKAAGNFAVKEAVSKVLGTGFSGFMPIDIEVMRDELGKPYVKLYGKAKERAKELGITAIHVSISDTKENTMAVAIGETV